MNRQRLAIAWIACFAMLHVRMRVFERSFLIGGADVDRHHLRPATGAETAPEQLLGR